MNNIRLFIRVASDKMLLKNSCCNFATFCCWVFTCTGLCAVVVTYIYWYVFYLSCVICNIFCPFLNRFCIRYGFCYFLGYCRYSTHTYIAETYH